ncbi:MAG: serine hydrolase [Methanocella sp.]
MHNSKKVLPFVTAALLLGVTVVAFAFSYVVAPGDSLWTVGQRFGVSVDELKRANQLQGDQIDAGQKLEVPEKPAPTQVSFAALKAKMQAYLKTQPATYKVYFQDLKTGQAFGIGENDPMTAASTTKVPTVLYLYTLAAQGKIDLNEKVAIQSGDYQDGAGALQFFAQPGDRYSLQTLANLAITLSDNTAHRMLLRWLGKDSVIAFMKSLGAKTVYPNGANTTTAADLAVYMRAVLSFKQKYPALGGRLVDDLEHTIWNAGLNGQTPGNVQAAHKEGDVTGVSNDFGVVYGSRPYLLVVLSSGQANPDAGFQYIAHLSKLAYDYEEQLAKAGA